MQRKICFVTSMLFILIFTIIGCSVKQPLISRELEGSFSDKFPIADMNKSIQIVGRDNKKYYPIESEIGILVKNNSNQQVFFNTKEPVFRIFLVVDDDWKEIENAVVYFGEDFYLEPSDNLDSEWITGVRPDIDVSSTEENDKLPIRIFIQGEKIIDGKKSGIQIGAFIDVVVKY